MASQPPEAGEANRVSTFEVLKEIGFTKDPSQHRLGFRLRIGRFELCALPCTNKWFAPIVLITGHLYDGRNLSEISDELPAESESREQAVAYIAWVLDRAAGRTFKLAVEPQWLIEGRQWCHLLPWERKRAAYEASPRCCVKRDWAKLALKEIAEGIALVGDDCPVSFGFDGSVLRVRCGERMTRVAAQGPPWPEEYAIDAGELRDLPKRLPRQLVEVSIRQLEGDDLFLLIGPRAYSGVHLATLGDAACG